ncbi:MAG TPA: HD domain-containing protein [Candidatus Saccharimonadales bacterium]|jgi:GTP pyrophosphokinase|nr:HD domain-containing protein [Candidatus Saccharimonadales bacterium]
MSTLNMTRLKFERKLQEKGLTSPLMDRAIVQVELSHRNQLRDNGNPYLTEHIYPVAYEVIKSYGDLSAPKIVVISALLHDCIEDDPGFTYETCRAKFGKRIADIVQALTKNEKENAVSNNQEEKTQLNRIYMRRLLSGPSEALIVKLADRFCNLATVQTIKSTNPGKYNRYIQETRVLFLPLAEQYSTYFYDQLRVLLQNLESSK